MGDSGGAIIEIQEVSVKIRSEAWLAKRTKLGVEQRLCEDGRVNVKEEEKVEVIKETELKWDKRTDLE
jgi:hypothetical protein